MAYTETQDFFYDEPEDPKDLSKFFSMFGPGHVDQQIRQAIQTCWMMLPQEKKNPDELEATLRRIFDRAIKNFREDSTTFGN